MDAPELMDTAALPAGGHSTGQRKGRMLALQLMDTLGYVSCTATSKQSGQRCKRRPIPGGTVCVIHGGGTPRVREKAQERLLRLQ